MSNLWNRLNVSIQLLEITKFKQELKKKTLKKKKGTEKVYSRRSINIKLDHLSGGACQNWTIQRNI